ncbi:MAG: hypothetical protein ACRC2G_10565 [Aestuariivirga sp.]
MQKLACLSLDRTPSMELIEGTVMVWAEALYPSRDWSEDRDRPRIREAFRRIAENRRAWPAPIDLRDAMPPPPARRAIPHKISEEQAEKNRQHIARLLSSLKGKKSAKSKEST